MFLSRSQDMAIELWKIILLLGLQSISVHGINFLSKVHISRTTPSSWEPQPPYREPSTINEPKTEYFPKSERICENPSVILKLTRTGLKRVNDGFVNSNRVTELHLDENEITEISAGAFDFLPKLELLNLTGNNVSIDRLLWFNELSSLRTLILDGNKRREENANLDHIFHSLLRLRELSLSRCGISRLTVNLKTFAPSLLRLRLSGNAIESSDFLEELPEYLSELYLDDNLLTSVRIGVAKNLEVLSVSGNKLEKLGDSSLSLRDASKMSKLNASRNRISEVTEDAFKDAKSLKVLDLSHNQLRTLPSGLFDGLVYLEKLFASHNQFTSIPNVNPLNNLKLLDLSGNQITSIGNDGFNRSVLYLETLLLANNHISNVDSGTFAKFPYLKTLDLSRNLLLDLPALLINYARSLQVFLLHDNSILKIDDLRYVESKSLQELHLQRNALPSVKLSVLSSANLPHLVIYLNDPSMKNEDDKNDKSDCKKDCEKDDEKDDNSVGDDDEYKFE